MRLRQIICPLALALTCLCFTGPSQAAFHLWDIKEVFSNADGSVQFIELFTTAGGQGILNNHQITATSDGVPVAFTFDRNLTGASTANKHFLIATAGFDALMGGVAPDYTIPANFFDPSAQSITINFANWDTVNFSSADLPTDGVMSLTDQSPSGTQNFVAGVNSPTNFPGAVGSINLASPGGLDGDYNDNGLVEQADLDLVLLNWGEPAEPPPVGWIEDLPSGFIDQNELDGVLLNWGNAVAVASGVPEPSTAVLLALALAAAAASFGVCHAKQS